jgi:dihydropteroate synthase
MAGPLKSPSLRLRDLDLVWGVRSYIMAILNITPDSFSGDGLYGRDPEGLKRRNRSLSAASAIARAVDQAAAAVAAGADILDVGGESTRPGAQTVGEAEELERVVPVIEALRARFATPISIDSSKAGVAEAAAQAGADLLNDVWGLRADPEIAAVAARRELPVVLMHNRSAPGNAILAERLGGYYQGLRYADLIGDVQRELLQSVDIARAAGIPEETIVLDPGLGFGKTPAQNLELLDRTAEIRSLGYPVLVGSSRKSFIGLTLDLPPDERLEGTAATVAIAIARGADILRVHDVREMARVARMTDAIVRR